MPGVPGRPGIEGPSGPKGEPGRTGVPGVTGEVVQPAVGTGVTSRQAPSPALMLSLVSVVQDHQGVLGGQVTRV